ncbi:hypothetical protein ACUXOM_002219 [Staphylococcus epidermidis]
MKKLSLENKRNINGGKCNNYKNAALGAVKGGLSGALKGPGGAVFGAGKGTVQGACS